MVKTTRKLSTAERVSGVENCYENGMDVQRGIGGDWSIAHTRHTGTRPGVTQASLAVQDIGTQDNDCHPGGTRRPRAHDRLGGAAADGDAERNQWCGCKDYDAAINGCIAAICMILTAIAIAGCL